MALSDRIHRLSRVAAPVLVAAVVAIAAVRLGVGVEIVKKAAGIPNGASTGVGKFINGAQALVSPLLAMAAAVAPIALIAGGFVLLFGGRRGMQIIATSLGVLLVLGSVTALVD
jgi:hypothetical protein